MNDELTKKANALGEALVCAVRTYVEFASVVVREFAKTAKPILKSANEYYAIQKHATPNERRMMHHRKKRIRRKYYNRVKRRVMR